MTHRLLFNTLIFLFSVGVFVTAPAIAYAQHITVITSNKKPVNTIDKPYGYDVRYLNLDAVQSIEKRLAQDLPINEQQALAIVEQRIAQIGQKTLNAELTSAYQAVITALQLGVDRYPAIIIDNQFVIYGMTHLGAALEVYHREIQNEETEYE